MLGAFICFGVAVAEGAAFSSFLNLIIISVRRSA